MTPDSLLLLTAFERAIGQMSVQAVREALDWWQGLSRRSSAPDVWAQNSRGLWRDGALVGVTFYRLLRALETGRTVPSTVGWHENAHVTLGTLIDEFEDATGVDLHLTAARGRQVRCESTGVAESAAVLRARDFAIARSMMDKRVRQAEDRGKWSEGDGSWMSQAAQMIAVNGARSMVESMGGSDRRRMGWVRVSGSGKPCAFCAMLLSRGAVYESKATAQTVGGYHPGCKCYAVPMFRAEELSGDKFRLNRQFESEWVTGMNLSQWRSFYWKKYRR
ncbi:hypothetical protein [Schaalia sp. ZJ1691]|uniref:VG15 protein n=1 Tax=Schaalia sp. ZJ1691 TaxID=2709404 RepID=UPI0013EB3701|nr:hypothetical protein [Schaalia sp. ZJ1691]